MESLMFDTGFHRGGVRLSPILAHRAGWDAGNKSMRAAGRSAWNEDDWNAAHQAYERLARQGGFWIDEQANDDAAIERHQALIAAER